MQFKQSASGYSLQDLQDFAFKWSEAINRAAYETWTYQSQTNGHLRHKGFNPKFKMEIMKIVFKELLDSPDCERSLTILEEVGKEMQKMIEMSDQRAETPFVVTSNNAGSLRFSTDVKKFAEFVQYRHQRGLNCYKELDDVFKSTQQVYAETPSPVDADALNSDATEDTPQVPQNTSKKGAKM